MDALKRTIPFIVALMMLLCVVPVVSDTGDAAGDANGVLIYEFYPSKEGVSLKNYGSTTVDLKDYTIKDSDSGREGSWIFSKSTPLAAGATITIVNDKESAGEFADRHTTYVVGGGNVVKNKSFELSDSGDDIYLYKGTQIIDAVCYGSKQITNTDLWLGESAPNKNGRWTERNGTYDSDTSDDWFVHVPGWTDIGFDASVRYDAVVTPFLFPEHGGVPIFKALEAAQETVFINIYFLGSKNMYGLLCDLEENGVDVVLLHEGNPLGIDLEAGYTSYMKQLVDAGGEISFIGGVSGDRYSYDHAKYCIIDGETTIVMSENWTDKNLNGTVLDSYPTSDRYGNRGWGAIIESTEYAAVMKEVFDNDSDPQYGDVRKFQDVYVNVTASNLYYDSPVGSHTFTSYEAQVAPMLSPDSSYDTVVHYIQNATERVYSEQQDLGASYAPWNDSPLNEMKKKADQGLDVRFILGGADIGESEAIVNVVNQQSFIKAATMEKPYVHNKGIVADNVTIVNSVNWTDNSFNNNREAGVVIFSKQISDYFANSFMEDFGRNYTYSGISVSLDMDDTLTLGTEATAQVTTSVDDTYTYKWNMGDGQTRDTTIPRIVFEPTLGAHVMTVEVYKGEQLMGTATNAYTVLEPGSSGNGGGGNGDGNGGGEESDIADTLENLLGDLGYAIYPIIVVVIGIIIAVVKRFV